MNWLDWVILSVLAYSTYRGFALGFLASAARLAGVILGAAAALSYCRPLAVWLLVSFRLDGIITPFIDNFLARFFSVQTAGANSINVVGSDLWARSVSLSVLEAVSFFIIVWAFSWAAAIAGSFLTKLAGLALLGPLNRISGLLLGLVRGLVLVGAAVYLLCRLVPQPAGAYGSFPAIGEVVAGSRLLPWFLLAVNGGF